MWVVAGLGNPGPEYETTRHNAGAWVVDRLARAHGVRLRREGRLPAAVGEWRVDGEPVLLCRPLSYMNESGRPIARLLRERGLEAARLIVAHDDLDLPPGALRLRTGGGLGGHHGLESIASLVGPGFGRVRLGIGRPPSRDEEAVVEWVLGAPEPEDKARILDAVERAALAVEAVVRDGWGEAMSRFNRRTVPGPAGPGG